MRPPVVKSCNFKELPILESRVGSGRVGQCAAAIRVITLWFLVLSQFFRDGMGPYNCSFHDPLIVNKAHNVPSHNLYQRHKYDELDLIRLI